MSHQSNIPMTENKKSGHVEHLEQVNTHTPPGEMEKGNGIAQVPTNATGPKIHHHASNIFL